MFREWTGPINSGHRNTYSGTPRYQREQNMFVYELVRQDALHSDFTINSLYLPLTAALYYTI